MRALFFLALLATAISCSNELEYEDYREEFVGVYECTKVGSVTGHISEFDVRIDPASEDKLLVNTFSVPISTDGEFERGELSPGHFFEMRVGDGELYIYTYRVNILGISIACEFIGQLKE